MGKVYILFGKPGAGKGTRLGAFMEGKEEFFEVLSVGNLLRKARKDQTELGKKAEYYMTAGLLVPDELVNKIVIDGINKAEKTVIIDGFPRTLGQAEAMITAGIYPHKVIELFVEDEVVLERAKSRIICNNCGEPYTTNNFKPPKVEGKCDKCGGDLVRRNDDDESVVKERLRVYQTQTYPVVAYLAEKGVQTCVFHSIETEPFENFAKLFSD